jgi:hypothetical protein
LDYSTCTATCRNGVLITMTPGIIGDLLGGILEDRARGISTIRGWCGVALGTGAPRFVGVPGERDSSRRSRLSLASGSYGRGHRRISSGPAGTDGTRVEKKSGPSSNSLLASPLDSPPAVVMLTMAFLRTERLVEIRSLAWLRPTFGLRLPRPLSGNKAML